MATVCLTETLVSTHTRRYNPEDKHRNLHRRSDSDLTVLYHLFAFLNVDIFTCKEIIMNREDGVMSREFSGNLA
jgi:hypothetical protein